MNKKLILCGVLVVSLAVNVGCQKQDKKTVKDDNKPAVTETVKKENKTTVTETVEKDKEEDDKIIKFESDKIDFSGIEYKSSETERDEKLEKAITDYLEYDKEENGKIAYSYNYVDLNGDGKEEIFVYLLGQYVSGSGGSTALIVEKENYEVISNFTLVRNPIIISEEKTNGWSNIIMEVSGGGAETSFVKLEFDGEKYPSNPSTAPKVEEDSTVKGVAIISNVTSIEDGIEIQ